MREENTTSHPELQVTSKEWLTFVEHSIENGFYSIANQVNSELSVMLILT